LLEFAYPDAALHFREAADLLPSKYTVKHRIYREAEAGAYVRAGDEKGDNAALLRAIDLYGALLRETLREQVPDDWATTQNKLGNALDILGERESGTSRLEKAVAAYRAALEERTRERAPLDWATTMNDIGSTLGAA
jgi:hypothetical protein